MDEDIIKLPTGTMHKELWNSYLAERSRSYKASNSTFFYFTSQKVSASHDLLHFQVSCLQA